MESAFLKLKNKVSIYVPETEGSREWKDKLHAFMSGAFGGSTETKANGAYVMADGSICYDDITIIYSYAFDLVALETLERLIQSMRDELKQESVGVEVNGKFYLV